MTSIKTYTRFLFFTGKGGVGKTSLACATAVKLADEGKKVLLISTDPASNLEDVLGHQVTDKITPHINLPLLYTININPDSAADEYRLRALEPIKNVAPADEYNKIKSIITGNPKLIHKKVEPERQEGQEELEER